MDDSKRRIRFTDPIAASQRAARPSRTTRRPRPRGILLLSSGLALALVLAFWNGRSQAANPSSGTLTAAGGPLSWTAGPFAAPNVTAQALGLPDCTAPMSCDEFTLTVDAAGAAATREVQVQVAWDLSNADFDLYVLDATGLILVKSSATGNDPETTLFEIPPAATTYRVVVAPFNPLGQSLRGTASLVPFPPVLPPGPDAPRYQTYAAPAGLGTSAGEPSLGVDWLPRVASLSHDKVNTGGVGFFTSGIQELRAGFDDCSSPATDSWQDVSSPYVVQSVLSDPIGFVDHTTGRVFQLDLIGGEGNSFAAFSDDDGGSTQPMQGGGNPAGPDHETLGAGPYNDAAIPPPPPHPAYANAVYYCSQNIAGDAECSRSDDGGLTFGPGVPLFNVAQCTGGIHGHVKVSPDGTVYVPNTSCATGNGTAGIAVSTDNGLTWTDRTVPGSTGSGDPSVGVGLTASGRPAGQTTGTIYLGWVGGDGHPMVAVSHDRGLTWGGVHDAGASFGIRTTVFPAVVAGDDDRAAYGFLGTPTGGNSSDEATFRGTWHLYIATTYDGGQSWTTVDTTPDDPVQVGSICLLGLSCGKDRNLLDFNDFTVDREGRALFGFADGCLPPGCNSSTAAERQPPYWTSRSAKASIARQSGGRRLFRTFDPVEPAAPGAPRLVSATRFAAGVDVRWMEPDDGGSPLLHYNVFRGTVPGAGTLLASTAGAQKPEFVDTTADPNTTYYYAVTATNAAGTGSSCGELQATGPIVTPRPPDSCDGVDVVLDPAGDGVNPAASGAAAGGRDQIDITGVSFSVDAAKTTLTTRLRLKNLSQVPVNGTTFTSYIVAWTSSDGRIYATEVDVDPATRNASWGEFDPNNNQLLNSNSTTHAFTTGPGGTISVDVPLGGVGSPAVPITDPSGTPAVTEPFALVTAGLGAMGAGLVFLQPEDRAPDSGFGQRWAVCPAGPAAYYVVGAPSSANAATPFNVTLSARDASGGVAAAYTGTAHFTSSDPLATLPPDYSFTTADAGVHTFSVTLRSPGSRTITATDPATSLAGSATVSVNAAPPPEACVSQPLSVVSDPAGDQNPPFPPEQDITSLAAGEDYRFLGSSRLVLKVKVADLNTIPANGIWRARFTFGATTYYLAMSSDGNSFVTFDYGTQSGNVVTSVGAIESGTWSTDGTITMEIALSKIGNPAAGSILTGVNAVTQQNVGGTVFAGVDSTGTGTYVVRPQAPACVPVSIPPPAVTYLRGGMTFSPSVTVRAPYIGQDVEPSVRADRFGNVYVAAIRGVPGGTDLWYFDLRPTIPGPDGSPAPNPTYDPFLRNPQYRGQPDAITGSEDAEVGGDGGGDVDMAVGFDEATPGSPPYLAYASLVLGNISTQRSTDRGVSWIKNPAGNVTGGVPVDDRQWLEFLGKDRVYLLYRTFQPAVTQIQRSIDGGLTYGPARTAGLIGQVGGIDVDPNDGTVYVSGSNGAVAVGIPPAPGLEPLTYTVRTVAGAGHAHLFFTVKVAQDGTAYVCYSDDANVLIQYSKDKGNTWSAPVRVNDGPETRTSIFPWIETGPVAGTIGVVWYGTDTPLPVPGNDIANWRVFYALGTDANTPNPTFRQAAASDHVIHAVNVSEAGFVVNGSSPNRNLADFFQVAFDPTGAAVIAYCDDHNDFAGHTFVTRQVGGPAANGATVPAPVEGGALPPPAPFSTDGSQVVDFRQDVRDGGNAQLGGLVVLPVDDPLDILSIRYAEENPPGGRLLTATMKVSDMTAIPPSSNWRINFAANVPDAALSPTGGTSFGLSDRADQFFLRASTDATGAPTFKYGTAVRGFDGSLTYTDRGDLDGGAFDAATKTVTLKVVVGKLNALLTGAGHPALGPGSILAGLRGQAFTNAQGNNVKIDSTRGGTQFRFNRPPAAAADGYGVDEHWTLAVPAPGVLGNDTDPDGDTLHAVLASGPSHGSLSLNSDGTFVYTPDDGFTGSDAFTYEASDGIDVSAAATVAITVFAAAGAVPDGSGSGPALVVSAAAGNLTLTWGASCRAGDSDYEVYEGTAGVYYSHAPKICSTGGATTTTFPIPPGNTYYLVVPRNAAREGSYGRASDGSERPPGTGACLPRAIAPACP